jgi:RecJ-like exonuclease
MSYFQEVSDGMLERHHRSSVRFEARLAEMLREAMSEGIIATCAIVIGWEICDICEGEGGHSRRFGVMVGSDLQETSEEFWGMYSSGDLDEPCKECNSTGKVQSLDESRLSEEAQKYIADEREAFYDNQAMEWAERFC